MKRIKRNGNYRLLPGFQFPIFRENKGLYGKLKRGEIIEVPDDVAEALGDAIIVVDSVKSESRGRKKKEVNINEVISFDED